MNNEITQINDLTHSDWWKLLLELIEHEIEANTEEICTINPENDKPIYSRNDILRSELKYLKFFKNTPTVVKDKYDSVIKTDSPNI